MMPLKKNILANYAGMGMVAIAPVLALPLYLAALGPKQFGLIAFIVTLQAVLGLLDAGMSQALVREITVRFEAGEQGRQNAAALLFGFERIYWVFSVFAACVTLLLANTIATHWLSLDDATAKLGLIAIYGAAAIFAVQFPGSVYRSMLVGAQAQVQLSGIMFGGALMRHLGGVIVVSLWPTLIAYLFWHAGVALLETAVRGRVAWRVVSIERSSVGWRFSELEAVWKIVLGMSGAAWLGALTVQMDKIVLSRMVTIEQFGYYVIAATVATGVLQLIYPLIQAILPRVIQMRADAKALRTFNAKLFKLIVMMVGVGGVAFGISGKWMLQIWLGNKEVVETVYPVLVVLLLGSAMNAIYNIGYINWIAYGKVYRVVQVNAMALLLSVLLIPMLVNWQGPIGAAFGWLVINLLGFVLSLEWLKREKI